MTKPGAILGILTVIDSATQPPDARQIDMRLPRGFDRAERVIDVLLELEAAGILDRHDGGVGYRWTMTEYGRGVLAGLELALR